MKVIIKYNLALLLLILFQFFFQNNFSNCCKECTIRDIQTQLNSYENDFVHIRLILDDYSKFLERKRNLVLKWKAKFERFQSFISCLDQCSRKYLSARHRFYRWLFVIYLKLKHNKKEIIEDQKRICCERNYADLPNKQIWLMQQRENLICSELYSKISFCEENIILLNKYFDELEQFSLESQEDIEIFKAIVINERKSIQLGCCCLLL